MLWGCRTSGRRGRREWVGGEKREEGKVVRLAVDWGTIQWGDQGRQQRIDATMKAKKGMARSNSAI
jgi:hypothetical protein